MTDQANDQEKVISESEGDVQTKTVIEHKPTEQGAINMLKNVSGGDLEASIQKAQTFFKLQDTMRKLAINLTSLADWTDEGGNPYMQWSGSSKIAMGFGVSYRNLQFEKESITDDKGQYIVFNVIGDISWQGQIMPEIGTGSSRDAFFGVRTHKDGDQKGQKYFLPVSEVDLQNVRKKALTNFLNRGIKSRLGLSFTWEEIGKISDGRITKEKVIASGRGVSFGRGSQGGRRDAEDKPETKKLRQEMGKWLSDMSLGSTDDAKKLLKTYTAFGDYAGADSLSVLNEKQVNIAHGKIKKDFEKFEKQVAGEEGGNQETTKKEPAGEKAPHPAEGK